MEGVGGRVRRALPLISTLRCRSGWPMKLLAPWLDGAEGCVHNGLLEGMRT
jgi:hypothetical protein